MSEDLNFLAEAEDATHWDHVWLISFDFNPDGAVGVKDGDEDKTPEEMDLEEGEILWLEDSMTVAGVADAEPAIKKLKDYVFDESKFGLKVTAFRLRGIKLLAETNI